MICSSLAIIVPFWSSVCRSKPDIRRGEFPYLERVDLGFGVELLNVSNYARGERVAEPCVLLCAIRE